jgi:hypothetical protein
MLTSSHGRRAALRYSFQMTSQLVQSSSDDRKARAIGAIKIKSRRAE